MDSNLEKLQEISPFIAKLVDGNDLTSQETEKVFTGIFLYDTEGYHLAVVLGAIHAKGETPDELLGFYNAHKALAETINPNIDINKTTDLSGTGGGSFKTINVSTAASFVVAAAGYNVLKAAYFGVTSPTGSADVFLPFGVDIRTLTKAQVEKALNKVGICPFNIAFISPKLVNRGKIAGKILGERQIRIRTPFHLATNTYSPLPLKHRIYGCYSEKYLEPLAQLFAKLQYRRTLTFYAKVGMPEISNVGETTIVEQNNNKIRKYKISPADLGIKEAKLNDIKTGTKEQNMKDFLKILKGKDLGPKTDLVAINSGASLYSLGDVKSIKEGVTKAKKILRTDSAYTKFEALVGILGSSKLLAEY